MTAENGRLTENRIPPDPELAELFKRYFDVARSGNDRCTPENPFFARLPQARVGTVDKFQGQEAAVVIYSMTTSSAEEAPRGMEFLYSLNRLNVATSRARCVCILVASPRLFEPDCKSPRQMRLANAFCEYLERQN